MRAAVLAIMSLVFLANAQDPVTPTLIDTTDLADSPDGRRLGVLLSGAPIRVLEKDGAWVKVSIEGWIEADHVGAATAAAPATPAAGSSGRISGSVFITEENGSTTVGSAIAVRLLRDGEEFLTAVESVRDGCDARSAEFAGRIEALKKEGDLAMRTNDTSVAFERYDEAKRKWRRAEKDLETHSRDCEERIEALAESHSEARTLTDHEGRYEFPAVKPGRYVLHATLDSGDHRSEWNVAIVLGNGEALTRDLTSGNRTRRISIYR